MSVPAPHPAVVPYLVYEDAPAAIAFLVEAFGFAETYRLAMPDGRIGHAELTFGDATLNLASAYPEMGLVSPRELEGTACQFSCWVDDVDAHYARAVAAGATVVGEPEDQGYGARLYRAVDPEGHRWMFGTYTKVMTPAELVAAFS